MRSLGRDDPLEIAIFGTLLKIADADTETDKGRLRAKLARLQEAKQKALADLAAESIMEAQIAEESGMAQGRYAKSEQEVDAMVKRRQVKDRPVRAEKL